MVSVGRIGGESPLFSDGLKVSSMNEKGVKRMDTMPKFERGAQAKWDKVHLRTVSTKLSKSDYAAFYDLCMLHGETPYSVMRRMIRRDILGTAPPVW